MKSTKGIKEFVLGIYMYYTLLFYLYFLQICPLTSTHLMYYSALEWGTWFFNTFWVLYEIYKRYKGIRIKNLHVSCFYFIYISYRYSYSALECASVLHLNSARNRNENEVNIVNSNSKELHSDAYGEYGWQFSCRLPIIKRKPLGAVCVGAF